MTQTPVQEKKMVENGLSNESEDSGNTSEQELCLPVTDLKGKKENVSTEKLDTKHLNSEMTRQNKKRHSVNSKPHTPLLATMSSSFNTTVKYTRDKTGLTNVGIILSVCILILLLICFILLIVMGALWPKIPHHLSFPICRRSPCLRASSEILPRMNQNASACDDFREVACGRWLSRHPRPPPDRSLWNLRRQLEHNTRDRLRQLILTQPHPKLAASFASKIKYFYESCMSLDNIETDKEYKLLSEINALGGWSVLREFQVHSFDQGQTFIQLHSKHGVPVFFKVDVVPDPGSAQDYIVQILPADLGLPHKSYYYRPHNSLPVETYKRYLKDVAQLLGGTSSDAASFSEDMFNFERRLAEITPDSTHPLHPLQAAHKITVAELKNLSPTVPFHDMLLAKFPEANIDDRTELLVPFPDHLRNISNLISTTDRSALNNYMMWRLTDSLLPYLNEKIRDTVAVYRKDLFGEEYPLPRWEMCIETMQKFMGFGLAVLLQNHAEDFHRHFQTATDIFDDVMRETKRSVRNAGWLPQELQEHIGSKLMSMKLEIGFPSGGTLLTDQNLEDVYRSLFIINRNFLQNVQYGIAFLQKQQQLRLKKFDEIYRWQDAALTSDLRVQYIAAANKVVVPQALLQEPYFHPEYPLAVLYGGLGVEMGSALAQSMALWDVLYADDGTLIDSQHPAVNQTEQAFLHPLLCLRTWWFREGFASPNVSDQTSINALVKLSGVNIALRALQEQLKHLPHTHQPALENYDDGHIFFITFAQSTCSIKSAQQKDLEITLDTALDDRSLLPVVVSQVKEFSRLFSCASSNALYTDIPCEDVI